MSDKEKNLQRLKQKYEEIRSVNSLPSFEQLNQDFHIEKLAEIETDYLIREIRKFIGDKLMSYLRFIEGLLNPVNAPMFVFSMIKLIDSEEKKKLSDIYKELVKKEVGFIELDLEFNQQKEYEFVRNSYEFWQKAKKETLEIMNKINNKWDDKFEANTKGYFG